MRNVTAGWETDLAILRHGGSSIEEFSDYFVIRTPLNPNYHWGNFILVSKNELVGDAGRWVQTFRDAFPAANWVSIGMSEYPTNPEVWETFNLELERMEVLKANTLPAFPEIDPKYTSRILGGKDWDDLLDREISENLRTGDHDPESYETFIRCAIEGYKDLSNRGLASWFGAFHGTELVADLGIVLCGKTARYQSVQTDENHRIRGLASHLLGRAALWASERGCSSWVIVTESTNDAGRVYRKAGFSPDVETVTAYKAGK